MDNFCRFEQGDGTMLDDHAKLMALIDQAGEIAGRRKLQKMIYILQKMGFSFHETYHFQYRGPYSEELAMQLEELYNFGFLCEQKDKDENGVCYRYRLNDGGRTFLTHYKKELPNVKAAVEILNNESVRFLELVSLFLYFKRLPDDSAVKKIRTFAGDVSPKEIRRVFAFIDALLGCPSVGLRA